MKNRNDDAGNPRALGALLVVVGLLAVALLARYASAAPAGASVTANSTTTAATINPAQRNDTGGTIMTLLLTTIQQDSAWKGYVGNVSGSLTLDDASGNTIYNWALTSVTGKVFASRASSVTWSIINCSNQSHIDTEQTALSFASSDSDSINKTFNSTNHESFLVAARNMTGCRSTATYVNDTVQAQVPTAIYPEILLSDGTSFVYSTIINPANHGYNNQSMDFQMIVPQSKSTSTATPYFFYIELG